MPCDGCENLRRRFCVCDREGREGVIAGRGLISDLGLPGPQALARPNLALGPAIVGGFFFFTTNGAPPNSIGFVLGDTVCLPHPQVLLSGDIATRCRLPRAVPLRRNGRPTVWGVVAPHPGPGGQGQVTEGNRSSVALVYLFLRIPWNTDSSTQ